MAARSLGTLTVDLVAKIGGFVEGMTEAERAASKSAAKIRKETAETIDAIAQWGKIASAAAIATGGAIAYMTAQSLEALAAQNDLAEMLGVTQSELVALNRAADLSGVSSESLATAMKKLNNIIGEAQSGSTAAAAALGRLGLKSDELASMSMEQRFGVIASAVEELGTQTERASALQDVFGKSGQDLLPMIQDGGETLQFAAEQTRAWGLALSQIDIAKVAEADDRITDVKAAFGGLGNQLAVEFAPAITVISEKLVEAITTVDDFGKKSFNAFYAVAKSASYVLNIFDSLAWAVSSLRVSYLGLVAAATELNSILTKTPDENSDIHAFKIFQDRRMAADKAAEEFRQARKDFSDWTSSELPSEYVDNLFAEISAKAKERPVELPVVTVSWDGMEKPKASSLVADSAITPMKTGSFDAPIPDAWMTYTADFQSVLDSQLEANVQYLAERDALNQKSREEQIAADWFVSEQKREIDAADLASQIASGDLEAESRAIQEEDAKKRRAQQLQGTKDMLGNLSTLMNSSSRKAFEIGKIAAIAQAVVNTAVGATKALSQGGILGPALAASVIAAGMVQIQSIRSQTFSGGGSPAASPTASVNAASTPVGGVGVDSGRNVFVHGIDPSKLFTGQQLIELINDAQRDGGVLRSGYV